MEETGRPFVRNYTPKEYNAAPSNWAIVQDSRGVMYFGNAEGILEYDGVSWRRITTPNHTVVRSLAMDQNDRIYVGEVGAFGYLAVDSLGTMRFVSLTELVPPDDRKFADVWSTCATERGIYFATYNALFRFAPKTLSTRKDTLPPNISEGREKPGHIRLWKARTRFQFAFVVNEKLYVDQKDVGLMHMEGDSLHLAPGGEIFAGQRITVMLPFDDHQILIGTIGHGLFLYDGTSSRPFATEADKFFKENQLYNGIVLANGAYALATIRGGVIIIDHQGRMLQRVNKSTGVQDNFVLALHADQQAGLWLALFNGIARVETPSPLSLYGEESGLKGGVASIIRHRGVLYAATERGVYYLETTKTQPAAFEPVSGIATQCWSFLSLGNDLLVASNDGVYDVSKSRITNMGSNGAISLHRSQRDSSRIFVGKVFGLGVLKYVKGKWLDGGNIPGIEEEIRSIAEDKNGRLWLGTKSQGILRLTWSASQSDLKAPQIERFGAGQGLPEGEINVYAVGRHFFFAGIQGIYRFDEASRRFIPDSSLGPAFANGTLGVSILAPDRSGNVWLAARQEAGGNINFYLREPNDLYQPVRTHLLRVPKAEIWAIYPDDSSARNSKNSIVWFGGTEGLVRYDPNMENNFAIPFPALIRRVVINNDSVIYGGTAMAENHSQMIPTLSSQIMTMRFEFSAASFEAESENQFQAHLEGFDKSWTSLTRETKKEYTNLPDGEYRFHVRASNVYEQQSSEAIYAFKILPPWYRKWWAYVFYGLTALAAILAVDRLQRRRLISREREKAAAALVAAENERKAHELNEARQLQLSMLPRELPRLPHIDIDVYMKTATEVGGDYYDFHLSEDGTLTVIIGDATGHGLNAGMVVTATKSALESLWEETRLFDLFARMNNVLRRMNLRKLYMALNVVRIDKNRASLCGVGMPPLLIYRACEKWIEEIALKGMPLGSVESYSYQTRELELSTGDVIVLMTDGFPERLNERGEILDYTRAKEILVDAAAGTPSEIIRHFVAIGDEWGGLKPQHDDMTFVVMKVREGRIPSKNKGRL